jgi:hypothetical protein
MCTIQYSGDDDVYKTKAFPGYTCNLLKKPLDNSNEQLLVCPKEYQGEELLNSSRHVLRIMPMQKVIIIYFLNSTYTIIHSTIKFSFYNKSSTDSAIAYTSFIVISCIQFILKYV